ncbi:MAG: glycosyltransferase family 4 protein [Bacteroidetes bacterium]|nr:glycosyltransferase family 4 protein [Bacteroidota bacterium]
MKKRICHLSSVHVATDTRIFYRCCKHLSENYAVTLIAVHPKEETLEAIHIVPFRRFKNKLLRVFLTWFLMFLRPFEFAPSCTISTTPNSFPAACYCV